MARLIECIPNFSCSKEKDEATYNELVKTAQSVPGCTLFDAQTDGNHNRCVFTLIGSPEAIEEVAFQLTKVATERIDMNKHHGEHKRMGATDVIPFVPQMDVTVEEAVEMSKRVAQRIWDELKVPSFLYEDSATRPERRNLATCRKGEFEGMPEKLLQPRVGSRLRRAQDPPHRRHHRHRRPVCRSSRSTATSRPATLRSPRRSPRSSAAPPAASAAARPWASCSRTAASRRSP